MSEQIIPNMFRMVVQWPSIGAGLNNGWNLATAVHRATPLPYWVRLMWPFFIKKAKFIKAMVHQLDLSVSLKGAQEKNINDFVTHLKAGPFLGGME